MPQPFPGGQPMPFEIVREANLIRATFVGIVTNEDLLQIGRAAAETEDSYSRIPPRVVDLSQSEGLNLSFQGILGLAQARRSRTFGNPFRSALVASNDAQLGFARMFQTLMDHPQVTIRIFGDLAGAEAWLAE